MPPIHRSPTEDTIAVIMGGGAGTRLYPLTKDRSKPAVPLGGKYRLVDVPISNCLNSSLRRVYVLTQFKSVSLHRHIQAAYKFDHFNQSFVEILAAQQTPEGGHWYQGTADAVRQNLNQLTLHGDEYYVILSGDQLYRMDYRKLLAQHIEKGSDLTIATIPVNETFASSFGIMHTDQERRIRRFVEKPQEPELLESLRMPTELLTELDLPAQEPLYQASMGIYVFNRQVLLDCLDNDLADFGKHIIPSAIENYQVHAYIFQGYWEDIGTIKAFFEANLNLATLVPAYSFFESKFPVYTHARYLPASKINGAKIRECVISDGCIITDATLERCVVGIRSIIGANSELKEAILMGADCYEADLPDFEAKSPPMGVGPDCQIERTIIDKNARIGARCKISPTGKPANMDEINYYIRDGIVVIPKNAIIPNGTTI